MELPAGTIVVVVGEEAPSAIRSLERFANVQAASLAEATDDEAARWSAAADAPYVVHDRDPLEHVAAAWVEFFDDQSTLGVLELEIARALDAAERHAMMVPDYYVVIRPEGFAMTWMHWWLGVIASASPSRVIPWPAADDSLVPLLRHLPAARAWPAVDSWLPKLVATVPDQVGLRSV